MRDNDPRPSGPSQSDNERDYGAMPFAAGSMSAGADANDEWLPDEALRALDMERTVLHPEDSPEDYARRIIRDNAPAAATSIVHIAIHGTNERTRLDASKYLVDRVLGKPGDDAFGQKDNPVAKVLEGLVKDAEDFANAESATATATDALSSNHLDEDEE